MSQKPKPDGYTIMLQAVGPMIQRPILDPSVGFDAFKDFTPIVLLGDTPNIILAGSKFPVQSIKEMVEWAKKNPGRMTVGHPGTGTMGHLGALMLGAKADFKAVYIAYRSGGQVFPDILGGQIDAGCVAYAPQFKSAHILAVMTPDRVDFLPGVPSMREAGYPGVYDRGPAAVAAIAQAYVEAHAAGAMKPAMVPDLSTPPRCRIGRASSPTIRLHPDSAYQGQQPNLRPHALSDFRNCAARQLGRQISPKAVALVVEFVRHECLLGHAARA